MVCRKIVSLFVLGCAVALISSCSKPKDDTVKNESPEPDDSVQKFSVVPELRYGRISVRWEVPEGLEDCKEKIVLFDLYPVADGNAVYEKFAEYDAEGNYAQITDRVVYHYQEEDMDTDTQKRYIAVRVDIYKDDAVVASGLSYGLECENVFPKKEGPVIGEDLSVDDITRLIWSGSGMSMMSIFNYSVEFNESPIILDANYFDKNSKSEKEIELDEETVQMIKDLILTGTVYRERAGDPDIEILDGGDEYFCVTWKDMRECDRSWYRISFTQENQTKLQDLFHKLVEYESGY